VITIKTGDPDDLGLKVGELGPVDATLNHLAGKFTEIGLDVLKRDGVQVLCGDTAAPTCRFPAAPFFFQHQSIVGSTMGTQPELERLVELAANDTFEPVIDKMYPIDRIDEAFNRMQDRTVFGKLVVEP